MTYIELGICAEHLTSIISDSHSRDFREVQRSYNCFKRKASKIGVQLPDLTQNNLSEDFLFDAINKVESYIEQHKSTEYNDLDFYRSEIDKSRPILDLIWVVSIVRLVRFPPTQHAFIVLEGKTGRKSEIWFADFVAKQRSDTFSPGTNDGKVRVEHFESEEGGALLFKCQKKMMNVRAGDKLNARSWMISKDNAKKLIEQIEAHANNPPKFNLLGNSSVLAELSADSTDNLTGHNCFTFAKKMLYDLNDDNIQLPEDSLEKLISITSRTLDNGQSYGSLILILSGVIVGFVLCKALS
ncbi:uncharacterized protein LOC144651811 [Oculina patagonica]